MYKIKQMVFLFCLTLFCVIGNVQAQEVDILLEGQLACPSNEFCVSVKLKASSDMVTIGTSSILLNYNRDALTFKSYTSSAFDGANLCAFGGQFSPWNPHAIDGISSPGEFNLTLTLLVNAASCPPLDATPIEVGVVCFDVDDVTADPAVSVDAENTLFNNSEPNNGTDAHPDGTFGTINGAATIDCSQQGPCINEGGDSDDDGVCNNADQCPGFDDALISTSCDDGDACTTGDVYDAACDCVGVFQDSDTDGVCDAEDICNGGDDTVDLDEDGTPDFCDACITGAACDDGDACTTGDVYDAACNCVGVFQDSDTDGVCDAEDICNGGDDTVDSDEDGTPDFCDACITGAACDDGDACTTGDVYDAACDCVGVFQDSDTDGVCDAEDICNGGDDTVDLDEDGTPDFCDACITGAACDDGDACTTGDVYDAACNCVGVFQDSDTDGVCDAEDICNGGDDTVDSDEDGTPDFCDVCITGAGCDDGDACTTGDVYDAACNCVGVFQDSDTDGVCDAEDICNGGDDTVDSDEDGTPDFCDACITGAGCDDGDACTTGDVYDAACDCVGVFQDSDTDGVCDAEDICNGGDDTVDSDEDGTPDFCDACITGAACDDGDACTTGDVYDAACDCVGVFQDSDTDGVCDAEDICDGGDDTVDSDEDGTPDFCDACITGAGCDDGDACTTGDVYDVACNCVGVFQDSDTDGVCDAEDICNGGDDTVDSDEDGTPDFCDACITGAACDDGDACTTGDVYDAACDCVGVFQDSDTDGVCDAEDICNGGDDTVDSDEDGTPDFCDACITGAACDDGDACTTGETYGTDCACSGGTLLDADNDNICDTNDPCPNDPLNTCEEVECNSQGVNTLYEYIDQVLFNTINNTSGNDGGYGDYTSTSTSVTVGATVDVTLTPGFSGGIYNEHWKIWIDLNQDGAYDEDTEEVFSDNGTSTVSGTVTIPTDALTGTTSMRISMRWNSDPAPCVLIPYGEVEDYAIIINGNDGCLTIGQPCDDANACTVNDTYDVNCNCIGTVADADDDGVCDAEDICPDNDDSVDSDNDGTPDGCDNCPNDANNDCNGINYCATTGLNTNYEYIHRVVFNTIDNISGNNGGYGVYTNMSTTVSPGDVVNVALSPAFTGVIYNEYWKIWIDFNQDGDFEDLGETVFSDNGTSTVSGTASIPTTALTGSTRMRVAMRWNSIPNACGNISYGEVEDYTVVINGGQGCATLGQPCDDNNTCTINDIYDANCNCIGTVADADDDGVCDAEDICPEGNDTLDTDNDGIPNACDLCPEDANNACTPGEYCEAGASNTAYEYIGEVVFNTITNASGDDGGYGDYTSMSTTLSTGGSVEVVLTPGFTGIAYKEYWGVWIDFNQDGDFTDVGEKVFADYGKSTVSGVVTIPSTALIGTTRMRVAMRWNTAPSSCSTYAYGEVEDYTVEIQAGVNGPAFRVLEAEPTIAIYPNPVKDILNVTIKNARHPGFLSIYNDQGQLVRQEALASSNLTLNSSVNSLSAGIYFIVVEIEGQEPLVGRFIKQD